MATFPPAAAEGALHFVANPGFEAIPHPFVPAGWVLMCAHWSGLGGDESRLAWTATPIDDSLTRLVYPASAGGTAAQVRSANALCFKFTGGSGL